jgi:hypothetical protein
MSKTPIVCVAFSVAVFLACGGSSTKPATSPAPVGSSSGDVPAESDKCLDIPTGCPGTADEDGCPDVGLEIGPDCNVGIKDGKTLARMAKEMQKETRLTRLRLVTSNKECAGAVATKLVAGGVAVERLETKVIPGNHYFYFEVASWDGKQCGP